MSGFVHVGLGPVGRRLLLANQARGAPTLVAAVDSAPDLAGKTLSDLEPTLASRLPVLPSLEAIEDWSAIDSAVVTTRSDLAACAPTFRFLLERGLTVVSTCEELIFPALRHPELGEELDALAREHGGRLLGTGVNPGLLMDALPAFASAALEYVRGVHVERIQDATTRRLPFQRKIGAGLDRAGFEAGVSAGWLRHVGLGESLHLLASALGEEVREWEESIEPVLAAEDLHCGLGPIPKGGIAGVRQIARGRSAKVVYELEFLAAIGAADPRDAVRFDADPPLELRIPGGVHGDHATIAMTQNALTSLRRAAPGLHTMATIPLVACRTH